MEIKQATLEDIDTLMAWRKEVLCEVFALAHDTDMNALLNENRKYYQTTLADGSHIACFAQRDGEIAGCGGVCFSCEMPSPDNPSGTCAYIMNVYVKEAYRQNGIGGEIIKWLVERAKERGVDKIYLETTKLGKPLYRSLGFVDMQDMMKLAR